MEWNKWYVAEVSNFVGNPIHRAIVRCISDGPDPIVEMRSYEDYKRTKTSDLPHFQIISEITDMKNPF